MSAVVGIARTWRVGNYTVTLTVPRNGVGVVLGVTEWAPTMPDHLTRAETRAYLLGRARALAEIVDEIGRPVGDVAP